MKVARLWSLDPERLQPSTVFVIKLVQVGGKWFEDSNPSPSKCALPTYILWRSKHLRAGFKRTDPP